eukprot:6208367-Pleurochrysis_carterae.AAC.2
MKKSGTWNTFLKNKQPSFSSWLKVPCYVTAVQSFHGIALPIPGHAELRSCFPHHSPHDLMQGRSRAQKEPATTVHQVHRICHESLIEGPQATAPQFDVLHYSKSSKTDSSIDLLTPQLAPCLLASLDDDLCCLII